MKLRRAQSWNDHDLFEMSQKRNVKVFTVSVIDCTREVAKENHSQFLQYTLYNLWNLTRPRMNTTNSKNTI